MLVVFASILLSACGDMSTGASTLSGTWKSDDPSMVAHISAGTIQIDFVDEDGGALYWKGTAPSAISEGAKFVSKGDLEEMEFALMASTLKAKEFTYKDGKLEFEHSILGITRKVKLERS